MTGSIRLIDSDGDFKATYGNETDDGLVELNIDSARFGVYLECDLYRESTFGRFIEPPTEENRFDLALRSLYPKRKL